MEATELKSKLHKYIDDLSNEQLLQALYNFLQKQSSGEDPVTEEEGESGFSEEEIYSLSQASGDEVWVNEDALWKEYYSKTKS